MTTKRAESQERTDLADKLRAAGLRRTGPRLAVLERLALAAAPLSHGELADELEPLGLDRATVYRNLCDLTDARMVRRSDLGDHVWRFSLAEPAEADHARQHPHLLCTACGTLQCLPDVKLRFTPSRNSRRSLDLDAFEVQLRGRCERCER
jgi:Fur family ferric uptake transcriptional regulator